MSFKTFALFMVMLVSHSLALQLRKLFTAPSKVARRSKLCMTDGVKQVKVLVPVAPGSEELETITIANTLIRAGAKVTMASVSDNLVVQGSRGLTLTANKMIGDCIDEEWDLVALPGGMPGAENLRDSEALDQILKKRFSNDELIAAICASPAVALSPKGILNEVKATGYPADKFKALIPKYSTEDVVVDKNIVTSQGPGTGLSFALTLVKILFGDEKAKQIGKEMLFK
jgi:4-methyl-5(b-hydroxyethyl)-thiazole monophosphate biosynthesis